MKHVFKSASLILLALTCSFSVFSQFKTADIYNETNDITWLGLDFTQTNFIGTAFQFKDAGEITDAEFKDKYAPGWNELFINEQKKFNVAEAVHRSSVEYATAITDKANSGIKKGTFTDDTDKYKKLDESKINSLVKAYDFKGKSGIGLLFIVDGISKTKEEAGAWVTFVDMKTKTVLLTNYQTGKAGGIGFRNYWAKAFLGILKDLKSNYKSWQKS